MSSQILHNQFTKEKIINYLITFLPISFIMGNLAINLNIILLIILSLFFFGLKIFQLHLNYLDKLIFFFLFFVYFHISIIIFPIK